MRPEMTAKNEDNHLLRMLQIGEKVTWSLYIAETGTTTRMHNILNELWLVGLQVMFGGEKTITEK